MQLEVVGSATRPFTSLRRKHTIREQSPAARMLQKQMRNSAGFSSKRSSPHIQNQQNKKIVGDLIKQLNQQIQHRQKIEEQLKEWKLRLVRKEMQFRQIISQYETDKVVISNPALLTMHSNIQKKIEQADHKTTQWLQSKFKESLAVMDKKIAEMQNKMNAQIAKNKKLSVDSYNDIMMEIQNTKNLAKSIDEQNKKLVKEVRDLKFKNQLLQDQRAMIIQQIIDKKAVIKHLLAERGGPADKPNPQRLIYNKQTQRNARFIGEPSLSSPKKSLTKRTGYYPTEEDSKMLPPQKRSIQHLQRTLYRERKRNYELSTLFTHSSKKGQQLSSILWQCINQAKRQVGDNQSFASKVVGNLAKSQKLILAISNTNKTLSPSRGASPQMESLLQGDFV